MINGHDNFVDKHRPDGCFAMVVIPLLPELGAAITAAGAWVAGTFTATELAVGVIAGTAIAAGTSVALNESASDPVEEITSGADEIGQKQGTKIFEKPNATSEDMDSDFDGAVKPGSEGAFTDSAGKPGRFGEVKDDSGRKITARATSSDGRPTLQINDGATGNKTEIRYGKKE